MLSLFQNILEGIANFAGKRTDYDKAYGFQCVDLVRSYAQSIGHPIGTFSGSAKNGWFTGSPFKNTMWLRTAYTTLPVIPPTGSIIFFDASPANPYGHVAIVAQGTTATSLVIEEQNAGSGNGD